MSDPMKILLLSVTICFAAFADAGTIADGSGFFPVTVQVIRGNADPVPEAMVRLEGLKPYVETELDPEKKPKILSGLLGKPASTNEMGIASVIYHGSWYEMTVDGKRINYGRNLEGIVVVTLDGKEIYRKALKDWAKERHYQPQHDSVPWIIVEVPAKR